MADDEHRRSVSRASEALSNAVAEQEDKPIKCAKFRQQELWAWKPVWSPKVVVIMYFIVSVIFIPLGVVIFVQSNNMVSTPRIRYDNVGDCSIGPGPFPSEEEAPQGQCKFEVEIERNITAPSYFYYGLVNFYQNARTYVTSRNADQLRGDEVSRGNVDDCEPLIEDADGQVLNPCGLVANSQFNDSFLLCRDEGCAEEDQLTLNGTNIAWRIDRERRFQSPEVQGDEDLMVWMRTSTYRNWKKLYRRIEDDIPAGKYFVTATSQFPVESFDGEKFFFIAETTWFGGPNEILGLSYIVVGCVALILAILIFVRSRVTQDLDLPPETTVLLDGIAPDVKPSSELPEERQGVANA